MVKIGALLHAYLFVEARVILHAYLMCLVRSNNDELRFIDRLHKYLFFKKVDDLYIIYAKIKRLLIKFKSTYYYYHVFS